MKAPPPKKKERRKEGRNKEGRNERKAGQRPLVFTLKYIKTSPFESTIRLQFTGTKVKTGTED